jgi:hypothetical protein
VAAPEPDVFDAIRRACAEVALRARHVRIDAERRAALADELEAAAAAPAQLDPAHHHLGDDAGTLAYVVTLDAVNFGSGWFPHLRKRPGLSGYFTIATSLKERFEARGPWSARQLAALTARDCATVFGQDPADAEGAELMGLFARALRDLGELLARRYDGRFEALVGAAGERAAHLVPLLAEMPFYRDVSHYGGTADGRGRLDVPLYKRAQLTAADLAAAFAGRGPGRFRDLDRLTVFADNLVPHVLRREGVLVYEPALAERIDAGRLLEAGSCEEVEIRAVALHAVEGMVSRIRERGGRATAQRLDHLLWNRGQRPEMKAHPRHRARSVYY